MEPIPFHYLNSLLWESACREWVMKALLAERNCNRKPRTCKWCGFLFNSSILIQAFFALGSCCCVLWLGALLLLFFFAFSMVLYFSLLSSFFPCTRGGGCNLTLQPRLHRPCLKLYPEQVVGTSATPRSILPSCPLLSIIGNMIIGSMLRGGGPCKEGVRHAVPGPSRYIIQLAFWYVSNASWLFSMHKSLSTCIKLSVLFGTPARMFAYVQKTRPPWLLRPFWL